MSTPIRVLLITAFLLIDTALGAAAWRHTHEGPSGPDVAEPGLRAARVPSLTMPVGQPFSFVPGEAVLLDVSSSGMLITAQRGDCRGAAPIIRISADAGKTVQLSHPDVREVLGVAAGDDGSVTIVGDDAKCRVVAARSTDNGRKWSNVAVRGWYADPDGKSKVGTPSGVVGSGCTVTAVAAVDGNFARVTCADGRIRGTGDEGKTWATLGKLANVRAATFDDAANGFALARFEGCGARVFATGDGGRTWKPGTCAGDGSGRAVASDGARLFAIVDDRLSVSADAGRSWRIDDMDLAVKARPVPASSPHKTDGQDQG